MPDTKVAICIATHRRPSLLRNLLRSLQYLTFSKMAEPDITIVVVDNDVAGSARPIITEFLSRRYPLRYRIESRKGIAFTRNTAIESARTADFVAFIDDDEEASPQWLDELLTVQAAFDAGIVSGPVVPKFQTAPPRWALDGQFFHRPRHATGTMLASTGAGNVLIARKVLHALSPSWFDLRYSLSGGEDTHFFRRCSALGVPVIWADDAVTYESVPDTRVTRSYLIARAKNGANHWTRVDLELTPSLGRLGARFAVGVLRVLQGSAISIVSPALAPQHQVRGRLLIAEGVGNLHAFLGHQYHAYGNEAHES